MKANREDVAREKRPRRRTCRALRSRLRLSFLLPRAVEDWARVTCSFFLVEGKRRGGGGGGEEERDLPGVFRVWQSGWRTLPSAPPSACQPSGMLRRSRCRRGQPFADEGAPQSFCNSEKNEKRKEKREGKKKSIFREKERNRGRTEQTEPKRTRTLVGKKMKKMRID